MNRYVAKTALTAIVAGGLLGGCATTVDMGGPLGHYRYNYDSRLAVSDSDALADRAITYRAPDVRYTTPSVTYASPIATYESPATVTYTAPVTTYGAVTTYSAPVTTYTNPVTKYRAPITTYTAPGTTTWRESRIIQAEPVVTYYEPRVVLEMHPSPSLAYKDHGQ